MNFIFSYPISALLYIVVILITTILSVFASRLKLNQFSTFLIIIIIMILSLFSGFRGPFVGTDTIRYIMHIDAWQNGFYNAYPTEPGLRFISILTSKIIEGPSLTLIVVSIIINLLIIYRLWSLRFEISFGFSVFLYSSVYFIMTFSGIRQWLALSIIFFAIKYLFEMKYIKFSLFVLFACLFHNTAVIGLMLPILDMLLSKLKYRKQKVTFLLFILLIPFIVVLENSIFNFVSQYSNLYNNINWNGSTGMMIWLKVFIGLLIFFSFNKRDFYNPELYVRVLGIYYVGLLITIPGYYIANLSRIGLYFMLIELILFGLIVKSNNKKKSQIFFMIIFIYTMALFLIELAGSGRGHMPYIPFWLHENY